MAKDATFAHAQNLCQMTNGQALKALMASDFQRLVDDRGLCQSALGPCRNSRSGRPDTRSASCTGLGQMTHVG